MEELKDTEKKRGSDKVLLIIGWVVSVIQLFMSGMIVLLLHRSGLLPYRWVWAIAAALIALIIICRLLMKRKINKIRYCIGIIIAALICVVACIGSIYINSLTETLKEITDTEGEGVGVCVYVRADDDAEDIYDAAEYPFGIMDELSRDDTDVAISMIEDETGTSLDITEYSGMVELADALLAEECDAIILNAEFIDMMTEIDGYEDFDTEVKEIASYTWTEITEEEEEEEVEIDPINETGIFTMYISGIDTWGGVTKKSRSDVNILAVVNTNTRQILLVSTPRDYYVELSISNGVKDKLTHAGIYGIDCSIDTIEMLYDTEINYYFRINFSGFEELIDALGGVTVTSEVEFEVDDYSFVIGENYMDGETALVFARERYSFASGDRQRGKNQMAVISAVVDKLQTTAVLNNFSDLMDSLEGSFQTDMSYSELSDLVQLQLSNGGSWDVVSYSVDGTGARSSTYSLSKSVYVMIPDEDTVNEAKDLINAVLAGETVSVD